ncbi:MAG: hypothetical protein SO010_06205, partial [Candidatus Limiplasma sp.]|nr:hypothetical protein [Candidatus Limiplasma sp.]
CIVRDFEDEDEILRCLIETNIRQRGRIDSNHFKQAAIIKEMERLHHIGINGGNRKAQATMHRCKEITCQADLAQMMGIAPRQLQNLKSLYMHALDINQPSWRSFDFLISTPRRAFFH